MTPPEARNHATDGFAAAPSRITSSDLAYRRLLPRLLGNAKPPQIPAIGSTSLPQLPLLDFFCSRKAPGNLILRTDDWAREVLTGCSLGLSAG